MAVYGLPKATKVAAIPVVTRESSSGQSEELSRFSDFWDMMDTIKVHGYVRAAMSVIGRSTIGAWWGLQKHEEFGSSATERQRKRLIQFYLNPVRRWDNIKDFYSVAYKLMIGAMYLRYFGQAAYQIIRNSDGLAVGFDFLPGYVVPNVDSQGYFKTPAFIQYTSRNYKDNVGFSARDIIYITNPDWEGYPTGSSDMLALKDFALPLDLYLQIAAREYIKNRDKPEAFYILPSDISDDAFNDFVAALAARYAGPWNVGKSPIAVQGDLEIKELSKLPSDLPYQESRSAVRQELLATSGVGGAKLGITDSLSSANLREARREFHETTMLPLFKQLELGFYEQIHVREFAIPGWALRFNNPDFLTAVERATVHMRYKQMSALTSNEIRQEIGKPARSDENGDKFDDQLVEVPEMEEPQGSPPEGREERPDAPSETGEPTDDDQDPVRGDQHDETTRAAVAELRKWRTHTLKRVKAGKSLRPFETYVIPSDIRDAVHNKLKVCVTPQEVADVFAEVFSLFEEEEE